MPDKNTVKTGGDHEWSIEQATEQLASPVNEWLVDEPSSTSTKAVPLDAALRLAKALGYLTVAQRQMIGRDSQRAVPLEEVELKVGRNKGAVAALTCRGKTWLRELLNAGGSDESR